MPNSNILMYTTEDRLTKIEATFENDTVWLSIDQMAELFQRDRSVIGKHVRNIFKEGELEKNSVWAKFAYTAADGKVYKEIDALNKIVTAYLDIAEVQALNHEPMYMKDWLQTIDDYLKMTRREILTNKGNISHKQAIEKAHTEYDKFKKKQDDILSPVEKDFIQSIDKLEQIGKNKQS